MEKAPKQKRALKCDDCKLVSTEVERGFCPYDDDVNNTKTRVKLCTQCYTNRAMDT